MRLKGQTTFFLQIVTIFLGVGVMAILYFMFEGKYFDINAIVESNEIERHVINIGQIVLSSKKLVYSEMVGDEERFFRGIFDKSKLDGQFIPKVEYITGTMEKDSEIKDDITYPNAVVRLRVENLDNDDDTWLFTVADYSLAMRSEFLTCLSRNVGLGFFRDYEECRVTYLESKAGTFEKSFPVLIKDGDSLYPSILNIEMTEEQTELGTQETTEMPKI